jgi:hypothetical protein
MPKEVKERAPAERFSAYKMPSKTMVALDIVLRQGVKDGIAARKVVEAMEADPFPLMSTSDFAYFGACMRLVTLHTHRHGSSKPVCVGLWRTRLVDTTSRHIKWSDLDHDLLTRAFLRCGFRVSQNDHYTYKCTSYTHYLEFDDVKRHQLPPADAYVGATTFLPETKSASVKRTGPTPDSREVEYDNDNDEFYVH